LKSIMSGSKEYFIDANIFLRVLVRENEKAYQECSNALLLIKNSNLRAYTATLVLAEINWVLANLYKKSKPVVVRSLHSILKLSHLSITDQYHFGWGLALYEKHNVKFIDAMIAAHDLIAIKNIPIISYDKDFDRLSVKRVLPSELL